MLNNILPTGDNLYKWKKVLKGSCIYCNEKEHNLKHLLWGCAHLNNFWNKISRILHVDIMWQCVVLGCNDNKECNRIISLLCYLIYKHYLTDREWENVHSILFQPYQEK